MKKIGLLTILLGLLACVATAQTKEKDIAGDWTGTLHVGVAELRLVLHVNKSDSGYKATLDSPDQNAMGIPVTSISAQAGAVNFTVDSVHGTYTGKLNADGSEIDGTWTQGRPTMLNLKRTATGNLPRTTHRPATSSDIDGAWQGTLDAGLTGKLRLVLHIVNTTDGLTATLDSPDQGAMGIPATSFSRDNSSIVIEFKQIAGKFEGNVSKHFTSMDSNWTQGSTLPLSLQRVQK